MKNKKVNKILPSIIIIITLIIFSLLVYTLYQKINLNNKNKEIKKISSRYSVKNLDSDLQFEQAIWKISADKYIILANKLKITLNNGMTKDVDGYVEIQYSDNEVVNIYNQEFSYQTISSNSYIELQNGIKLNLGTKIVSQNDQNKMSLEDMVINSNDNVKIVDLKQETNETEETNTTEEENNTTNEVQVANGETSTSTSSSTSSSSSTDSTTIISNSTSGGTASDDKILGVGVSGIEGKSSAGEVAAAIAEKFTDNKDWTAKAEEAVITFTAKEKAADVDLTETNMTGTTIASTPAEDKISYTNTTSGAAPVEGKKASYTTAIVTNNVAGTATVKSKLLSADVTVGVASADTAAKFAENIAAALNKDTKFSTTYKASTNGSSLVIEQRTAANTRNFTTDVNFSLTFE